MKNKNVAFAMGGLAGNNAHGAGFLQAAIEKNIEPILISCTSGQVFWVYQYLTIKEDTKDLKAILAHEIREAAPTGNVNLDSYSLALFGRPGVFRPAHLEFAQDLYENTVQSMGQLMLSPHKTNLMEAMLRMIPSRTLIPLFDDQFFSDISESFNQSEIGLAFNSYNPIEGIEYIHLNEKARSLLGAEFDTSSSYRERTEYRRITPETVKQSLWIYQYGFDADHCVFDGAYYRQIMLSELVAADRIYVVRPINSQWLGDLPTSYPGVEDLKTEVSFNGTYIGEKDKIHLINKMLEKNMFRKEILEEKEYHPIELIEIEIETQEDFFDYINEKLTVFDSAKENALKHFSKS